MNLLIDIVEGDRACGVVRIGVDPGATGGFCDRAGLNDVIDDWSVVGTCDCDDDFLSSRGIGCIWCDGISEINDSSFAR